MQAPWKYSLRQRLNTLSDFRRLVQGPNAEPECAMMCVPCGEPTLLSSKDASFSLWCRRGVALPPAIMIRRQAVACKANSACFEILSIQSQAVPSFA